MTNPTLPDLGAGLPPELLALVSIGDKRRPVKIVEHPAFRAARARRSNDALITVLRVPVVALDSPEPLAAGPCLLLYPGLEAA